jgi:DNA-binding NtrC family response regulator
MTHRATPYHVLIADDEETLRFVLRQLLEREGCVVDEACDGAEAVEKARAGGYDLYLLDMKMPRLDGIGALREIRALYPDALVVMITAFGSSQLALEALRGGAFDYFTKPFNMEELRLTLMRALDKHDLLRQISELRERIGVEPQKGGTRLIGEGEQTRRLMRELERVAAHDVTVLITGESGTGKELVAQIIHERSACADGPLVKVNCAAIPEPLLESELFGHERGAFTGAVASKPGKFELAHGGTIFLDEIGELPPALQAKFLRVLQEREVDRVGSTAPRSVNARVLAATNRDLRAMVERGAFREDLFFRINVFPLRLPPLRERPGDLPPLVQHFIGLFNARFGKRVAGVTPEAMALLERHPWPGNIRELENAIQRAMVLTAGPLIGVEALNELRTQAAPASRSNGNGNGNCAGNGHPLPPALDRPLAEHIESIVEAEERRIILEALERMGGRRQETADRLGISRKSLHNKMVKYDLFAEENAEA